MGRGDLTDLLSVVDELGTPLYVYELAEVRANQQRLRGVLPERAALYYALSANPHPELLREIRAGGARPLVCSPGELDAALVAGWPADEVLYTGPGRRDHEVDWALWLGVRDFTVDSPAALGQLDRRAAAHQTTVRCLLRVNICGLTSSGADIACVRAEPARLAGLPHAQVAGLHLCAAPPDEAEGSGGARAYVDGVVERFATVVRSARELTSVLAGQGGRIEVLGLTGDFDAGRCAGLRTRLTELLERELPAGPRLWFQADRQLVGSAGTLVTTVLDVRQAGDRQVVVLESGVNHLGGFDGRRRREVVPRPLSRPNGATPLLSTELVGPLETPHDVWASSVLLPRLGPGDLVAVPNVGASGLTAGLAAYAGIRMPVEVVVDQDDPDGSIAHVSRLAVIRYPEED